MRQVVVDMDASEEKKWAGEGEGLGEEETFSEKLPAVEQKADHDSFIGRFLYLFVNPHAPTDWCVCARAFLYEAFRHAAYADVC